MRRNRLELIAAMAQAIDTAGPNPYETAEAVFGEAMAGLVLAMLDHGVEGGILMMAGDDPDLRAAALRLGGRSQ